MFLRTETHDLETVRDELAETVDEQAERAAELPSGSDAADAAAQAGLTADRHKNGIEWALDEWGADTQVELGAITTGSRDFIAEQADRLNCPQRNAYIAVGTIDAPYLEHDPAKIPTNPTAVSETIAAVPDFHPGFTDWLNESIGDLGQLGADEGKSFRALVREKRRSETSTDTN